MNHPLYPLYPYEKYMTNTLTYRIFAHHQITSEPHSHDFLELAYILDGECTHILNGTKSELKKGDYVIIDYNSVHNYICKGDDIELIDCLFVPKFIDHSLSNCKSFKEIVSSYQIGIDYNALTFTPTEYIFHDNNGFIKQLLTLIDKEYYNPQIGSAHIAKYALSQILILSLRQISTKNSNAPSEIIQYVINACKTRYYEKKLLDTICKEIHYSKPYISTKFKSETNKHFKDYLIEIRINEACRLLSTTNKRISEISSEIGYDDVAFFINTFKARTSLTPAQFRKTVASDQ